MFSVSVQCQLNEFRCDNGQKCLEMELLCDGEEQCGDGSDEFGCDPSSMTLSKYLGP
jgi:hypothetical protein